MFCLILGSKVVKFSQFSNLMQTFAEKFDFLSISFGRVNHFALICSKILKITLKKQDYDLNCR